MKRPYRICRFKLVIKKARELILCLIAKVRLNGLTLLAKLALPNADYEFVARVASLSIKLKVNSDRNLIPKHQQRATSYQQPTKFPFVTKCKV
jgi:hypothetical protein